MDSKKAKIKCVKFKIKEEMREPKENKKHYVKILFSKFSIISGQIFAHS